MAMVASTSSSWLGALYLHERAAAIETHGVLGALPVSPRTGWFLGKWRSEFKDRPEHLQIKLSSSRLTETAFEVAVSVDTATLSADVRALHPWTERLDEIVDRWPVAASSDPTPYVRGFVAPA